MTAEIFKPKFSTSAEVQEKKREKREKLGASFADRVTTVHGSATPCEDPNDQFRKPINFQPAPTRINVAELGPLDGQRK